MSSIVNIDLMLICSKDLLPKERMVSVLDSCLKELNCKIENNVLYIKENAVGKIIIKDRILVQTYSERRSNAIKLLTALRELYTRKSKIEFEKYKEYLEEQKRIIKEQNIISEKIEKELKEFENKINKMNVAKEVQEMSPCEAIVAELKEAAECQGYDVVEEKTDNGVQLQFVRRSY